MKKTIHMPRLSPEMEKGVLVSWNKEPGEKFQKGDILFEVETEKVVSEVEATEDGIMGEQFVEEGDEVAVDAGVAHMETSDGK